MIQQFNHMIDDCIEAPWNEQDYSPTECHACRCELNDAEREDPCMIDDEAYCDKCASDLVQLKYDGYLRMQKDMTFKLKYEYNHGIFTSIGNALKP